MCMCLTSVSLFLLPYGLLVLGVAAWPWPCGHMTTDHGEYDARCSMSAMIRVVLMLGCIVVLPYGTNIKTKTIVCHCIFFMFMYM